MIECAVGQPARRPGSTDPSAHRSNSLLTTRCSLPGLPPFRPLRFLAAHHRSLSAGGQRPRGQTASAPGGTKCSKTEQNGATAAGGRVPATEVARSPGRESSSRLPQPPRSRLISNAQHKPNSPRGGPTPGPRRLNPPGFPLARASCIDLPSPTTTASDAASSEASARPAGNGPPVEFRQIPGCREFRRR